MENLEKNEMVLNFDELNKLDQFEQADIVWSIIEKLGFKGAKMEPAGGGYDIYLECADEDEDLESMIDDRMDYYYENNEYTEDVEELASFVMAGGEIDDSKYDEVITYIKSNI